LKATDDVDVLNMAYKAKVERLYVNFTSRSDGVVTDLDSDRITEYHSRLMNINAPIRGMPVTEYDTHVTMLSNEFTCICRDLSSLGQSNRIEVSKEVVKFVSEGQAAQVKSRSSPMMRLLVNMTRKEAQVTRIHNFFNLI
jgi:proliferating cell nuclear antigen